MDGRSCKGSSGSPFITFPREAISRGEEGGPVNTGDYFPQRVVGIMRGRLYQDGK